jgi:uncharacterized protein
MTRKEILDKLEAHQPDLKAFGVKSIAIFGSAARDQLHPDSDVDILVDFVDRATFDAYMETKFFLEALLDRQVDLVTRQALRPRLQDVVEKEAIYFFIDG